MIIAIMVMFVSSLLMVAAFTAANGDIHLSHIDLTQKQAYFAALAGVQEYEYGLGEMIQQHVRLPVHHPVVLLNSSLADGLGQVTLARAARAEKQSVFPLSDESKIGRAHV